MLAARVGWRRCIFLMVLLAGMGIGQLHAADGGVPSNEDLRHVRALAEPQVSPDGSRVLIRVESFSPMTAHLLAQGWAVFLTNPRGSTGYGAAFAAANKNDLGGSDLKDIMAGVDAVVAAYSIDRNKLALMGVSGTAPTRGAGAHAPISAG